jgi:hypothetical protein
MFPANWLTTGSFRLICSIIPKICSFGDYILADDTPSLNDPIATRVYMGHYPSGTSMHGLL